MYRRKAIIAPLFENYVMQQVSVKMQSIRHTYHQDHKKTAHKGSLCQIFLTFAGLNLQNTHSDKYHTILMKSKLQILLLAFCCQITTLNGQTAEPTLTYHLETGATAGGGDYAPLWFTANRNGLSSVDPNSAYLEAGLTYNKRLKNHWGIKSGLFLATAANNTSAFIVQQAYADVSWRFLNLSIGSKERDPEEKNPKLSSGGMVEGNNTRPVPQVRLSIEDFTNVPLTNEWLKVKGYVAYGRFTDDRWQRDWVNINKNYVGDVFYHSKLLMFRVGKKEKFPLEFDLGMLMAAQFRGRLYRYDGERNSKLVHKMPFKIKDFFDVFIPSKGGSDAPRGDQVNVYGNHVGSWLASLSYYANNWRIKGYYEHFFEDHSQMFFEYGRWKDGHIGVEITFPKNRWINTFVWEGLATKDQSGPFLYDGYAGAFTEYQISANDSYYNNYYYQSWQHWGMGMGNPLLPGPLYNKNKSLSYRSNRMKSHHIGINGNPTKEIDYRILLSYSRHWGTYKQPLDEIEKQFSSLYEVTYSPRKLHGWSISAALGVDHGSYLGNNTGGMLTIKKQGIILK